METRQQPRPFDADWIRYCPEEAFPPYRHIPGVTPHPIRDPRGHSYDMEEDSADAQLLPTAWRQNRSYLCGVDLYNFAYWWEAHEAWEGLWHEAEDTYRLFLQGLIQVSAACIKYHSRMLRPLCTLSTAGRDKLRQVVAECDDPAGTYMGIHLPTFLDTLDTFFAPFFTDTVVETTYREIAAKPLILLRL